jgi:hypothetical protein
MFAMGINSTSNEVSDTLFVLFFGNVVNLFNAKFVTVSFAPGGRNDVTVSTKAGHPRPHRGQQKSHSNPQTTFLRSIDNPNR